jgi:excisionase family DNA binding protein
MLTVSTIETEYLSFAEAADLLRLHPLTVYRRVWDGSLASVCLSEHGAIRIPREAIESPARAPRTGREPAVEAQAHGGSTEAA